MEALRDAVVFAEAPHAHDLLLPVVEGFAKGLGFWEGAGAQLLDVGEQGSDEVPATSNHSMNKKSKLACSICFLVGLGIGFVSGGSLRHATSDSALHETTLRRADAVPTNKIISLRGLVQNTTGNSESQRKLEIERLKILAWTYKQGMGPSIYVFGVHDQGLDLRFSEICAIVFDIDASDRDGFFTSTLILDQYDTICITNSNIAFDFIDGANPTTFINDGLFNLNTFFNLENGDPFGSRFNFGDAFTGDTFTVNVDGYAVSGFDATSGSLEVSGFAKSVPEASSTFMLLLVGFAAAIIVRFRQSIRFGTNGFL